MKVYIAMTCDDMSLDDMLVADSLDGIKSKCEKYCREVIYDELIDAQTEVSINKNKIFVHITGKDPEEIYTFTNECILDNTIEFFMSEKETEL